VNYTLTLTEEQTRNLTSWWLAVRWSRLALEDKISASTKAEISSSYDNLELERVIQAEQFLEEAFNQVVVSASKKELTHV
jgi:hypothetical protein